MTEPDLKRRLRSALLGSLARVPGVRLESPARLRRTPSADLTLRVVTPCGPHRLVCEVKTSGQPRYAREAVNRLLRFRQQDPAVYPVMLAPWVSAEAAAICAAEGAGHLDLAGNCHLAFGGIYIERQGYPNPAVQKRVLRSLYSPKAERVLRVLLSHPATCWRTEPLAAEAQVSLGQVANVKKLLLDREWVEVTSEGFRLAQLEALLSEWGSAYRQRSQATDLLSIEGASAIEEGLRRAAREWKVEFALTEFSAAARLAPFVRHQRVTAYWGGDVERVKRALDLKSVPGGSNVRLLRPHDRGVYYGVRQISGMPVVSLVQAYLDLQRAGLRSEDAANEILSRILGKQA